jgi:hypothetical protein
MNHRLVTLAVVIAAIAIFLVPALPASANPASFAFDAVVSASCKPGAMPAFNFHYAVGPNEYIIHVWTLTNERTGDVSGPMILSGIAPGTWTVTAIPIDTPVPDGTLPGDKLTERVEVYAEIPAAPPAAAPQQQGGRLVASDEISWTCGGSSGPGCGLPIPEGSVVGAFVSSAPVFWEPGKEAVPPLTIEASKTAWVLGVDATLAYYKIIWACQYLWVPVGTMGPNNDTLWNGKALPVTVVK